MPREFISPTGRETPQAAPGVLEELERRREEIAAEAAEEQRRNAQLAAERNAVAADEAAVQDRIDQLLSASPEDFVIIFVQTEGQ